ncbi:PaaI family thioesterase, partial [Acinetobacter baumannii]
EQDAAGVPVLVMPFRGEVMGRPGFLHGGAISGLMEVAAIAALRQALETDGGGHIKPINVTVDFMRGGRDKDTRAIGL